MLKRYELDSAWLFQELSETNTEWFPASVPGTIHQDLLALGRIPDPYFGRNEADLQWIGERDWAYRCRFDAPDSATNLDLCFDGLDTIVTVWLNGQEILKSENMFVPQRIPVKSLLKATDNELKIVFHSAFHYGKAEEAKHGKMTAWNGDVSRVYVRKAQYHYGWDWGPCFITAGIWKAVYLESYEAKIEDIDSRIEVSEDLQNAQINCSVKASSSDSIHIQLYAPTGELVAETESQTGETAQLNVANPALWYPFTQGEQALYLLRVELSKDGALLDRQEKRLGLRRLRLVQEPIANEEGSSFYFEINNQAVYAGGANWIPADTFLPRISPEKYRAWLQVAVAGNLNMLRVWGGGIYESDLFYDYCDKLGILVWQDFMFACGMYPAHPDYLASVRAEAEANIRRLRHHPALVIWAGNNEDYSIAESIGAYDPNFEGDFTKTKFPAREIYERLLPEVCSQLDPLRPYWQGSPYSGKGKFSPEKTVGDRHTWDVWHGGMNPYQNYTAFTGRFISEFGMQGYPHRKLLEAYIPAEELSIYSQTMDYHNKATQGSSRIAFYLASNFPPTTNFDKYLYLSQLLQAEALSYAYVGWRRQWGKAAARKVGGALVWQINDSYPVVSWATVDYHLSPKLGYYATKRALAPLCVGLAHSAAGIEVWASSDRDLQLELELSAWSLDGERLALETRSIGLEANQVHELGIFAVKAPIHRARLLINGEVLARHVLWQQPLKYLALKDPQIQFHYPDAESVQVTVSAPTKGLWLDGGEKLVWTDNGIDILPDEVICLKAVGLNGQALKVYSLNSI